MIVSMIPFTTLPVQAAVPINSIVLATSTDLFKSAVEAGGSIKLGADMEIDRELQIKKPLTLDLAGHTLTFTTNNNTALKVQEGGSLVLNDSSEEKSGKITTNTSYVIFSYASAPEYGDITINGGTIETTNNGGDALYVGDKYIKVTINGGKLIGKGAALQSRSDVDIARGVFDGNVNVYGNDGSLLELNITGGYFKNVQINRYTQYNITGGYFAQDCDVLDQFPSETYTVSKTPAADGKETAREYPYKVIPIGDAKSYNVSTIYNSNSKTILSGTEGCKLKPFLNNYSYLKDPTRYGLDESYRYDGFYYDAAYTQSVDENARLTENTTVYVKFVPIPMYTVTVKYNLKDIPDSTKKVRQEQAAYVSFESLNLSSPNPEQYGIEGNYIFEGYYTDP